MEIMSANKLLAALVDLLNNCLLAILLQNIEIFLWTDIRIISPSDLLSHFKTICYLFEAVKNN
jgi:hypothetical protein